MTENRYERLFGFHYRKLIDDLSRNLAENNDNDIITSILLYKSFNDSFYYVGLTSNPLLKPAEIFQEENPPALCSITPKTLWYLGAYLCSCWGIDQIKFLFENSDRLVKYGASTFDLTHADFGGLKNEWLSWLEDHRKTKIFHSPAENIGTSNQLLSEVWFLGNFLLTLIPIPASYENSSASEIFHLVMGLDFRKPSGWIRPDTGEFKINVNNPYRWRYQRKTAEAYGQLINIIEFLYMVPASKEIKETTFANLYLTSSSMRKNPIFEPPDLKLTALAIPLFHNCEFQGIVYTAKRYRTGGFTDNDQNAFRESIKALNISSLLADARFDLAHISILRDTALDMDWLSLNRILNRIHIFSSAVAGITIIHTNDKVVSFERCKCGKGSFIEMITKVRNDGFQIDKLVKDNFSEKLFKRRAIRVTKEENQFNSLRTVVSATDKISSILVASFPDGRGSHDFIIIYFGEVANILHNWHTITWQTTIPKVSEMLSASAERVGYEIEKLVDRDAEHKKLLDLERSESKKRIAVLPMWSMHYARNVFGPQLIRPLNRALNLVQDEEAKRYIRSAIKFADRYHSDANLISASLRSLLQDDKLREILTSNDFKELCLELKTEKDPKPFDIQFNVIDDADLSVQMPKSILKRTIEELLTNAQCAMKNEKMDAGLIKINWKAKDDSEIEISVWNSGTSIAGEEIKKIGLGPLENVAAGQTGLGLYFLNIMLKILNVKEKGGKYFLITNTDKPKGVKISFVTKAYKE